MSQLFFKSISELSDSLIKKEISPVELTNQLFERIESLEPSINAYITLLKDESLEEAKRCEEELLKGEVRGPLHGVPIAIKDILETKGSITTSGSKVFEKWESDEDATVVKRLKEAGAIIVGKTNLHEFAMGATTENPHYGPTRNPWNLDKIPGGSSGGSAAAVAAGMCYGALGTDTAGSIRLPAAICGIVGLKPTYDVVSRKGCTPLSWTLDHIGPMTRTVEDSAMILKVIAEPDQLKKVGEIDLSLSDLKGVKIGVSEEYFFDDMDSEMEMIVRTAMKKLVELGAEIVEVKIPHIYDVLEHQKIISKSEGYTFHEKTFTKYPEMYGEDLQIRLNSGKTVLASEYLHAQRIRNEFIQNTLDVMKDCDVILSPTNVIVPYDIGSVPPEQSINNIFNLGRTPVGNMLGFPTLTVPCGLTGANIPVGLQLMAKPYQENKLLNIGHIYEKSEQWVDHLEQNKAYEQVKI